MQMITIALMGLFALGVLIFVHELGHFAVAKWAGIKVLKFSLGFGQKLIGFKHGETEYVISALPLGGFVKMAGENPDEVKTDAINEGDYFSKPWWVRLLVLLAGPGMNFITAMFLLSMLYWIGFNIPIAKPQIISVEQNSPAFSAGVLGGDVIVGLNDLKIENWEKFSDQLNKLSNDLPGQSLSLTVLREGKEQVVTIIPQKEAKQNRWKIGIAIGRAASTVIDRVIVGTPAELAGLKNGDKVISVENKPVWSEYEFKQLIWSRSGEETKLKVERQQEIIEVTLTPIGQHMPGKGKVGVIGVGFKSSDKEMLIRYPFFKAIGLGVTQTTGMSKMILTSLGQMITGKISAKDSLGGPITIMRMAGQEAKRGFKDFVFFIAGISVMLAVLNLLPIPVLDGGSAVFFIIEGIMRKPVSIKIQERSQQVGFIALIGLMLFATVNDIYKLIVSAFGG